MWGWGAGGAGGGGVGGGGAGPLRSELAPGRGGRAPPRRIRADYQVESCLGHKEDGRLILRLRRKSDGKLVILKAAPAEREDLAEEWG